MEGFVYPTEDMITPLIGKPSQFQQLGAGEIRNIDLKKLLEVKQFLPTLSLSMIDRTGLDLWILLRRMTWKISPTPIRLLSQNHPDPLSLWKMNRTKITEELAQQGYIKIAEIYTKYYTTGWEAFFENFSNSNTLRKLITLGFEILKSCVEEIEREHKTK
jgi:hypothetical protein